MLLKTFSCQTVWVLFFNAYSCFKFVAVRNHFLKMLIWNQQIFFFFFLPNKQARKFSRSQIFGSCFLLFLSFLSVSVLHGTSGINNWKNFGEEYFVSFNDKENSRDCRGCLKFILAVCHLCFK